MTWYRYDAANGAQYIFSTGTDIYFTGSTTASALGTWTMVTNAGVFPVTLAQIEEIVGTIPAAL
jgi:hypothetical protein